MDKIAKAIVGAVLAAYAVWQVARGVASPAGPGVTADEWTDVAVTAVVSFALVWAVPNDWRRKPAPPSDVDDGAGSDPATPR